MKAISPIHACSIVALLSAGGCRLTLDNKPAAGGPRVQSPGPGDADAAAGDAGPVADASTSDGAEGVVERLRHESCAEPILADVPREPDLATDARGRPLFDSWTLLGCEQVADYPICEAYQAMTGAPACYQCLGADDAGGGVCAPSPSDEPRELCVPLHDLKRDCWLCVPPAAKAQACCLGLGVDCKTSDAANLSGPGQACAHHTDCEPGLLCVDGESFEAKLCACPGETPRLAACAFPRAGASQ